MSIHIWYYKKEKKKNHKVVSQSFYWFYGDECPIGRLLMLMLTSQFYCWAFTKHWSNARASRPMNQSDE